jgi:drug/metabolite transporter (DMT)-like permease
MDACGADRHVDRMLPLAIVIVSGVVYHLAQKAAGGARPWPMLTVAYGAAFAVTAVLSLASCEPLRWPTARVRGAGLLVGLAAFGIEAGFFYIYRARWPLASASVIANVTVTGILALIGIIVFREHLSLARAAGLALATAGAALIAKG